MEEVMEGRDIVLLTETHQSRERGLPNVEGYQWESAFRGSTRQSTTRGSGGIAVLFRKELHGRIQIVARDAEARYMWIRLQLSESRALYIALCYFPPKGSRYAHGDEDREEEEEEEEAHTPSHQSPFSVLSEDILQYASMGEVLLMGDFNARTQSRQCTIFDFQDPERLHTLQEEETCTGRISADTGGDSTGYGRHLLELGSRHHLVIYNGMAQWPGSGALTCFPLGGGGQHSGLHHWIHRGGPADYRFYYPTTPGGG